MSTKTSRFVHLVCVTSVNNNKYYNMTELSDGSIEVKYGRVGGNETTHHYPGSKWDSLYRSKIAKGYQDMTDLVEKAVVDETPEAWKEIEDEGIRRVIEFLREKARDAVKKNYIVASSQVSQAMVDEAQRQIDHLAAVHDKVSLTEFNDLLLELFRTIPRRMSDVRDHLATQSTDRPKLIAREQSLLDVMAGQVTALEVPKKEAEGNADQTILDAHGLKFAPATDADIKKIKKLLGKECEDLFLCAWKVENKATQKKFNAFIKEQGGKLTKKLFWHGSRTENWWSILRSGLVLRPSNAMINGKMFGYGTYFANRARKSLGYTSLSGSYWAGGNSQYGFMALYEVAYGEPYDVETNVGVSDMSWEKLQKVAPGKHCLHAHAGKALMNDEIIVYREDQTTIKYLVELKRK